MNVSEATPIDTDGYGTEPSLALAPGGGHFLAWSHRDEQGVESIRLRAPDGSVRCVSAGLDGHHGWPTVAVAPDGTVAVAWSHITAQRSDGAQLRVWRSGSPEVLSVLQADSVRWPVATWADGWLWIAAAARTAHHHISLVGLGPDERTVRRVLDRGDDIRARPSIAALDHRVAVAWEAHGHGTIQIRGSLGRDVVTLVDDGGFAQAPALHRAASGLLLAWQTDRPTHAPPTLARWVRVARLDDALERVESLGTLPGMTLVADGEDQSLEFPALCQSSDGAIWLVARASHNFRAQRWTSAGWEALADIDEVLWGCRGTRIGLVPHGDHGVTLAVHGRRGIETRTLEAGTAQPVSSDAAVRPRWGELAAFWGDIHFHSAASDGVGTVEEAYLRCRDRYGDDFACLTDHDAFIGRRISETVWRSMVDTAESFNRPEEGFATLIGIEYTGVRYPGPGHKCVYFDGPDAALVCRWDGLEAPADLLARVRALGGVAIPHHVGWLGGDPDHHDPDVQPAWEVCSTHGQYEAETTDPDAPPMGYREGLAEHQEALRTHFIRRQLEAGKRFGFVGGSDGHGLLWHHGVGRKADSHRTGLTGVWLESISRGGVLDAIRSRRTFATSGGKIALGYRADGQWMGSELDAAPRSVEVVWSATGAIELCALASVGGATKAVYKGPAADVITLPDLPDHGFLFLRLVEQDTGETAWASPVFW